MLTTPMDVLDQFPVRKTKKQKQDFRDAVVDYATAQGYSCSVERRSLNCQNLVIGDPEKAGYLVTAHYDTCARMLLPNLVTPCNLGIYLGYQLLIIGALILASACCGFVAGLIFQNTGLAKLFGVVCYWVLLGLLLFGPANPSNVNDNTSGVITLLEILRSMPVNQRSKVCFVLFDLEEAGLIGSSFHRAKHRKASDAQLVFNLDCVGDGDHILLFPTKELRKDRKKLTALYRVCGYFGKKSILVQEKRSFYPSDQLNFPVGIGVGAFRKSKRGIYYYGRIHTPKDTVLDMTNVNILRAALTTFICCDEVN